MYDSDNPNHNRILQYLTEYLCSLNLAWALVWVERTTNKSLGGIAVAKIGSGLVHGLEEFVVPIGGSTILDQLIWSFIISVVGFSLFCALRGFTFSDQALRVGAGALAIVAFPVATQLLAFGRSSDASPIEGSQVVLTLETAVVLICGVLFLRRNRLISVRRLIALLICHFVLWAWMTSSYINVFSFVRDMRASVYYHPWGRTLCSLSAAMVFNFGFPAFGFLASLSWVLYINSSFSKACKTALG